MHFLSLDFALFFLYLCFCWKQAHTMHPLNVIPFMRNSHTAAFQKQSLHSLMMVFQHFTSRFAFPHIPHCQPPSSCISDNTMCQEQSRDSRPQTAQPQVWSHLPFQAGSTTRVSVITEPALSLLHYGTISYFKLLPFKFWNNHMQAGAKPLQIPLPLQQPFQNLHFRLLL